MSEYFCAGVESVSGSKDLRDPSSADGGPAPRTPAPPTRHHLRHTQGLHQTPGAALRGSGGTHPEVLRRFCQQYCVPGGPHGLQRSGGCFDLTQLLSAGGDPHHP